MPLFRNYSPILKYQYSFTATGNTTADVLQVTFEFPAGCMGANGTLSGTLLATCSASATPKRIRAYISNTDNGLAGTRFINFSTGTNATIISINREFTLFNKNSQSNQITNPSSAGGGGGIFANNFESLSIDTSQTFYVTIGLQKDVGTDSLQMQMARLTATSLA